MAVSVTVYQLQSELYSISCDSFMEAPSLEKAREVRSLVSYGAIKVAELHLGFSILEPLTEYQAAKFHAFVLPLISKVYKSLKNDEEKVAQFHEIYENSLPADLLIYLVEESVKAES